MHVTLAQCVHVVPALQLVQTGGMAPSTSTQPTGHQSQMAVFPSPGASAQHAAGGSYGPHSRPDTLPLRSPQGHPQLEGGVTPQYQVRTGTWSLQPPPLPPLPLPLPCLAPSFLQGTPAHTPMMMSPAPSPMVVHSPYSQPPPSVVPPMQQPNTPAQQPSSVMARHPPNMVAQTPNMVTQTPPNMVAQPPPNMVAQPPNMAAPPNVVISHNAMSHLNSPHHMMQERPFYYAPSPNPVAVPYQMGVQSPMATIASVGATPMSVNGGFYSQTMKG